MIRLYYQTEAGTLLGTAQCWLTWTTKKNNEKKHGKTNIGRFRTNWLLLSLQLQFLNSGWIWVATITSFYSKFRLCLCEMANFVPAFFTLSKSANWIKNYRQFFWNICIIKVFTLSCVITCCFHQQESKFTSKFQLDPWVNFLKPAECINV